MKLYILYFLLAGIRGINRRSELLGRHSLKVSPVWLVPIDELNDLEEGLALQPMVELSGRVDLIDLVVPVSRIGYETASGFSIDRFDVLGKNFVFRFDHVVIINQILSKVNNKMLWSSKAL